MCSPRFRPPHLSNPIASERALYFRNRGTVRLIPLSISYIYWARCIELTNYLQFVYIELSLSCSFLHLSHQHTLIVLNLPSTTHLSEKATLAAPLQFRLIVFLRRSSFTPIRLSHSSPLHSPCRHPIAAYIFGSSQSYSWSLLVITLFVFAPTVLVHRALSFNFLVLD